MRCAIIIAVQLMLALAAASHHRTAAGDGTTASAQCQYVLSPAVQSFTARGGSGGLSILAAGNCAWTAASNAAWINITSANSGTGVGRVNYSVLANPTPNQRTGVIIIAGQNFVITQAGTDAGNCAVTPISAGQTVNGSLNPGDCRSPLRVKDGLRPLADRYSFSASSGQPIVLAVSSTDFDTYVFLLDAGGNVIAQNDDTVQGGSRIPAGSSFFTLPSGGTFIIEVTSFSGDGAGNYALSLTMPAGGCSYAISQAGQSFTTNGGTGTVNISTQPGCAWTAMSNNNWLTISSGGSGTGAGTVSYSVAANAGAARTSIMNLAGLKFIVTQSGANGAACPMIANVTPPSGAPGGNVTINGANFTGVTAVKFTGGVPASFTIAGDAQIMATIPNGATSGPLTISKPTCTDAATPAFTAYRAVASVSAASFLGGALGSESIAAAFGSGLATGVSVANSIPLPTALLGTTVKVKDSVGIERAAPLFFVAPTQINFLIPAGTANGPATVTVTSGDGAISQGNVNVKTISPGVFTANASGQGLAAAVALRVRADGSISYEPITQFDPAQNRVVAVPIDLGPETDQVFLLLFGTGWRFRSALANVSLTIGGLKTNVDYAGPQGDYVGLDQINARLSRNLIGRGEVDLALIVDGVTTNTVKVTFK